VPPVADAVQQAVRTAPGPGDPAPPFRLQDVEGAAVDFQPGSAAALIVFLVVDERREAGLQSRRQTVSVRSMAEQYADEGLRVLLVDPGPNGRGDDDHDRQQRLNLSHSWQLQGLPLLLDGEGAATGLYGVVSLPTVVLVGADGRMRKRWSGQAPAPAMALAIQDALAARP
jgi:hypothetical protein